MKYRCLGRSGLQVSRLCLGTMTFGAENWGCDEAESHAILREFIAAGGNFIDCADIYAGGRAEEIVGYFLPEVSREELVIASKCGLPAGPRPNLAGLSRKHILSACEGSLKRLRTDHLDLYYLHIPDPVTPYEETIRALEDLVRQGKVRYLGVSNFFAWQMAKAAGVAARLDASPIVAGQYIYSLIHRELEWEILPAAADHGIGITAYSPLGGGLLTGKYRGQERPAEGTRHAFRRAVDGPRFWNPTGFATAEIVGEVAAQSSIRPSTLAIGWPLGRRGVSAVVIGARSAAQLAENLEAGERDLPPEVWARLEERTRPPEDYLAGFVRQHVERFFKAADWTASPPGADRIP